MPLPPWALAGPMPLRWMTAGAVVALSAGAARAGPDLLTLQPPEPTGVVDRSAVLDSPLQHRDWTIRLEPAVWLVSPSGLVTLPGSGNSARMEDLNLDTPKPRPSGEIHFSADRWRFSFFGSQYANDPEFVAERSFSIGDVSISPGDTVEVEFDFTVVEVAAGYLLWSRDYDAESRNPLLAVDTDLAVYGIAGLQLYDVDMAVADPAAGTRSESDQTFAAPILGIRAEADIAHDFSLDLQMSGGGYFDSDRSNASLDIVVGFQWRPHPNVGVQVGWRQLAYWLQDGDGASEFEYNGRMAGVQGSLVIRF